ncbi:helix-turn-helix transcriptional regulator [Paenibacillus sp. IB182496]|uniref:Helix-turn-helix transcriptional regulator n=1 Tax=Paenibacillus sabuli TaxID=2772509 RepID=A0A927BSE1_9BACL|nr:AraC family transcriptional regulator [Paenibacillus sabuli]MBD2844810.1 helix-turn-helix transcriptional regulator [Paenibacillus sabuli]
MPLSIAHNRWDYLTIRTKWVREMKKSADFQFGPVTNPFTVCWLVRSGARMLEIDGKPVRVAAGDVVFFHADTRYRLLPGAESERTFHYLSIGCELSYFSFELPVYYGFPTVLHLGRQEREALAEVWMKITTHFEASAARHQQEEERAIGYFQMKAALYEWLGLLFSYLDAGAYDSERSLDSRILQVCYYVELHYHQPLTLQQLAREAHLSPSYLSHLFVQAAGVPPMEFVRRVRLTKAKQRLIDSAVSLQDIARQTGYESQSHFSRAFRRAEGISPLQYRKKWRSY